MNDGATLDGQVMTLLPLLAAAVGWYVASRAAVHALAGHSPAPLRRAVGHCIPVGIVAIIALIRNEPQIAIGVIFRSSVACLSLVLGVVTLTAPPDTITVEARRKWLFILPATMLVFLAGYKGQFTWTHAAALAIEGVVILLLWGEKSPFANE